MKLALPIARKAVDEFYPKAGLQIGEIKGLDLTLKDALDYKYIPAPKSEQDIAGLFDILYSRRRSRAESGFLEKIVFANSLRG